MDYTFNPEVAEKVGVDCAVMLQNLAFWLRKNQANDKHYYDGYYWTYNSVSSFCELFPFWKDYQIRRILEKLEGRGIIKSGNYNATPYDRTKWYTIVDKSICQILKIDLTKMPNGKGANSEPIPYNKTDSKPDSKQIYTESKDSDVSWKRLFHDYVYLKEGEYEMLCVDYGKEEADDLILALNTYLLDHPGKRVDSPYKNKYRDHYMTLCNWAKRNGIAKKEKGFYSSLTNKDLEWEGIPKGESDDKAIL